MRYIVRSVDGAEYGPFTREELQQLVRERRLGLGDFVRREEGRTWSPFERIAGLSDLAGDRDDETGPITTGPADRARPARDAPVMPTGRPRLDPTPERLDDGPDISTPGSPPGSTPGINFDLTHDLEDAIPIVLDGPADSSDAAMPIADASMSTPPTMPNADRPRIQVDPARSENPFVAGGLPIDLVENESIQFVLVQSFTDAMRSSLIGAVLGHRARLVCTDRRVAVLSPGFGRTSMTVAWLDRADRAGVELRTSTFRLVIGVLLVLYAAYMLLASLAGGAAISALGIGGDVGGLLAFGGAVIAIGAGLLGVLLVLTARARAVTVGDDVEFPCAAAGPWHLARIDEGRMRAVGEMPVQ